MTHFLFFSQSDRRALTSGMSLITSVALHPQRLSLVLILFIRPLSRITWNILVGVVGIELGVWTVPSSAVERL
jgi:hypothetical protein